MLDFYDFCELQTFYISENDIEHNRWWIQKIILIFALA